MSDAAGLAAKRLLPREFCMLNEKAGFWEVIPLLGESVVNMGAILDCGEGGTLNVLVVLREKSRSIHRDFAIPADDHCLMHSSALSHTNKDG